MSTPRHPPIDRSPCDRCGKLFNHTELDAVFLCEDRSIASEEAYCKTCFPHMRVFAWDYWQSLEPISWSQSIKEELQHGAHIAAVYLRAIWKGIWS